jgi:predicted ribosome quality control (RQC) complex YloA/Tae2 family protein
METRISSFDIRALVEEAKKELQGAHLDKVQQIGPETFKFSFSTRAGKRNLIVEIGKRFNLTEYDIKAPEKPSQFSLRLRHEIESDILGSIEQYEFDRVVVLRFTVMSIVLEFFSNGNIILMLSDEKKILLNFRAEQWKDRTIAKGQLYLFPKGTLNPYKIPLEDFKGIFTERDAVRSLAKNLSFGGDYAEEICYRAGIDKNKEKPTGEEKEKLYSAMRQILYFKVEPVMQDGRIFPFPLRKFEIQKRYKSMNAAIDEFYIQHREESPKLKKLKKRLAEQQKALLAFEEEIKSNQGKGNLIYTHYQQIEKTIGKKKGKFSAELD